MQSVVRDLWCLVVEDEEGGVIEDEHGCVTEVAAKAVRGTVLEGGDVDGALGGVATVGGPAGAVSYSLSPLQPRIGVARGSRL
jgi:hypothetical protein